MSDLLDTLRELDAKIKAPAGGRHAPGMDDGLTAIERVVDALPALIAHLAAAETMADDYLCCLNREGGERTGELDSYDATRAALSDALRGDK